MKQSYETKQKFHFTKLLLAVVFAVGAAASGWGQYAVNFDGADDATHANNYGFTDHDLNGITWTGEQVIIPTTPLAADWYNGVRSARFRGYGTTSMEMTQNKTNGTGTISFQYRRYGSDEQVEYIVEYSINNGTDWDPVGSPFTAPASDVVQTFSHDLNVGGDVRIRIRTTATTGTANRRLNIDDLLITDYPGGINPPSISNIIQSPAADITTTTTVSVSADVAEGDVAIEKVELHWNTTNDFAAFTTINMTLDEGSTYTTDADIPVQTDGVTVYYRVYAEDTDEESSTSPVQSYTVRGPRITDLPYLEDFEDDFDDIYIYSVAGTQPWSHNSSSNYAEVNGHGGEDPENHWLILPGINLDEYYQVNMTFDTEWGFGSDNDDNYLKLFYSSNYAGVGDPNDAVWEELTFAKPTTFDQWTSSGDVNLSSIEGTSVWLAFEYLSTDDPSRWRIDNIEIYEVPIVEFNFEDESKRGAITDNETWTNNPYTADRGTLANKDIAYVGLVGGPTFNSWLTGRGPNTVGWDSGENTKYWQITISTLGFEDLKLSSVQRSSNTGPRDFKLQYSTNNADWFDVDGADDIVVENNYDSGVLDNIGLNAECENQETLYLRWIMRSNIRATGGTDEVLSGGTSTIDNIRITGSKITDATYNTIAINGTNEGWQSGEIFENITGANADFAHFTWDEDYLYFAVSGSDANIAQATFMYFDTNPGQNTGTTNAYTWGEHIVTSFLTDYVVVWKNQFEADYIEVREWNGSGWVQVGEHGSTSYGSDKIDFAISGNYREVRIKRSVIGSPEKITVASITEQVDGHWRYFGWPSEGWTDGNRAPGQTMTHGYTYELKEFVYPNEAQYLQENLIIEENTTVEANTTVDNVYILPGQNLTVNEGIDLTVNGKMFIFSDATGTGSLIHSTPGVEAIVEYYMPDSEGDWPNDKSTDWYWISAPVTGQGIVAFLEGYEGQYDLYRWGESEGSWLNYKAGDFAHTSFEQGTGYLTAFEDERTHKFDGELIVENITWSDLTYTTDTYEETEFAAGWHLIGNPYASGIVFSTAEGVGQWTETNVELTPQVWNAGTQTYDAVLADEVIESATAFFVRATAETNTLTIPAAARQHLDPAKNQPTPNYIVLAASPNHSPLMQRSYLRIEPDANDIFDNRYDSRFRSGNAPIFYSFRENHNLLVNAVREIHDDLSIPFVFEKIESADEYSISLKRTIEGTNLYLVDLKLDKEHELTVDNPYLFTSEVNDTPYRFNLRFSPLDDDDTVNVPETDLQDALKLWFHNNTLFVDNASGDTELRLYDSAGRFLQSFRAGTGQQSFELQLSAGVYVVHSTGRTYGEPLKIVVY